MDVASLNNSLHVPIECFACLTFLSLLSNFIPVGIFFFFQIKQNGKSRQAFLFIDLSAKTKSSVFSIIPTTGRSLLAEICPKRVQYLLVLDSPYGPATWGLCNLRNFWCLSVAGTVMGLLPLETLSNGLTSWEFTQAALWRQPCPPPGRVFVVVYILSKYVIPLGPSYIIYASPVFREGMETKLLLESSPAD